MDIAIFKYTSYPWQHFTSLTRRNNATAQNIHKPVVVGDVFYELNTSLLANSILSLLIVWPILLYIFPVTSAFIDFKIFVVAYTLSTGTCGPGSLVPIKMGVPFFHDHV
ncbi:MAG: hypothetical protein ACXWV1_00005, partial [Chitinophagaceae bacterium]